MSYLMLWVVCTVYGSWFTPCMGIITPSNTSTAFAKEERGKDLHILHIYSPFFANDLKALADFAISLINERQDILPGHQLVLHSVQANPVSTPLKIFKGADFSKYIGKILLD